MLLIVLIVVVVVVYALPVVLSVIQRVKVILNSYVTSDDIMLLYYIASPVIHPFIPNHAERCVSTCYPKVRYPYYQCNGLL